MFDCADQFGEGVATAFNHLCERVERAFGLRAMASFKSLQAIHLELFFEPGRADHFHRGEFACALTVAIQTDEWAGDLVDLLFVAVRGVRGLAALVPRLALS